MGNILKGKVIKIVLALIVLAGIAGTVLISMFSGSLIKQGVETVGPVVTGVSVKLDKVGFSLLNGKTHLQGFEVGNPTGFKTPYAVKIGEFDVDIRTSSLLSDTIIIDRIHIIAPSITYEGSLTSSNISTILDNISGDGGASGDGDAGPAGGKSSGKKIFIKDFLIEAAEINLSLSILGGTSATLPLPTIHLTDIGTPDGGVSIADATKEIFSALLGGILKSITSSGDFIGEGFGDIGKAAKGLGDEASKVLKGIGGLFKKK